MSDLERQCEEIRNQYLSGISADEKCHPTKAAMRTLLAYIDELRRPSEAKEIQRILDTASCVTCPDALRQDIRTLGRALAESQRECARLQSEIPKVYSAEAQARIEIARLMSPPEERRDILERQPALRYTLVSGNWNDAYCLIQKAIADIDTLLQDCARHRNAHAVNMARAEAAERRVAELENQLRLMGGLADSCEARTLVAEGRVAQLTRALREAERGLARCYNVCDYPGDGTSFQDQCLRDVRAALASPLPAMDNFRERHQRGCALFIERILKCDCGLDENLAQPQPEQKS
jgi:hypothetical protein